MVGSLGWNRMEVDYVIAGYKNGANVFAFVSGVVI